MFRFAWERERERDYYDTQYARHEVSTAMIESIAIVNQKHKSYWFDSTQKLIVRLL